jgi:hypothetical protein
MPGVYEVGLFASSRGEGFVTNSRGKGIEPLRRN